MTYFPIFKGITHFANPKLETALSASPVTVIADPSECSFQFKATGTEKFTTGCDIAKSALVNLSVNYNNQEAPKGTPASVKIGEQTLTSTSPDFAKALPAAIKTHGYPASADPADINHVMTVVPLWTLVIYVTLVYAPIAAWLVELFPSRIRYSGLSLPYHIGNGWFGGCPACDRVCDRRLNRKYLLGPVVSDHHRDDEPCRRLPLPAGNQGRRHQKGLRLFGWGNRRPQDRRNNPAADRSAAGSCGVAVRRIVESHRQRSSGARDRAPRIHRPDIRGTNISIDTQILRARRTDLALVWSIAIAIPLLLIAPALWNGYPLLQYDTGGYLARWYEGYLVPSRSTAYGIYLHLGEASHFWLILGVQALSVMWIVQATLRVFGIVRPIQIAAIVLGLCATTALPVLTSLLLTDIFSGLSVLTLFLLVVHGDHFSKLENLFLFLFTSFAASTHSATLGVLLGVCCVGWILHRWLPARLGARGLIRGSLTIVSGAAILLACNFALSGQLAWTPGGSGIAFGRMLQDGLVKRYLDDHCSTEHLKLCPYRNELPQTGDGFLWGDSVFNDLGQFKGLGDEMAYIAWHSLIAYPGAQSRGRHRGRRRAACFRRNR